MAKVKRSPVTREWTRSPEVAAPQLRDEGVLKVFAGADPLPIMRRRAEWHRAKLAELEGYLGAVSAAGHESGVRQSLLIGTGYHRVVLEALERYLASQEPAALEPQAATGSS